MNSGHESPVRRMIADAHGTPYHSLESLEEAQKHPDGVVVFEGDDGGQIYLTCPASQVRCSEVVLNQLLEDIDARAWDDLAGARVFYERMPLGATVVGGMGGGVVTDGLWLHPTLSEPRLSERVQDVLAGRSGRLNDELGE